MEYAAVIGEAEELVGVRGRRETGDEQGRSEQSAT